MKQPWGTFIVGWAGSGLCRESLQMSHEDDHLPGGALHTTTTTTTSHLPPNPTAGSGLATALPTTSRPAFTGTKPASTINPAATRLAVAWSPQYSRLSRPGTAAAWATIGAATVLNALTTRAPGGARAATSSAPEAPSIGSCGLVASSTTLPASDPAVLSTLLTAAQGRPTAPPRPRPPQPGSRGARRSRPPARQSRSRRS